MSKTVTEVIEKLKRHYAEQTGLNPDMANFRIEHTPECIRVCIGQFTQSVAVSYPTREQLEYLLKDLRIQRYDRERGIIKLQKRR